MSLKPFTVRYKDAANQFREFCCYAFDAYHARVEAMEMVQHCHDNPNAITHILKEDHGFDW